MKHRCGWVWTKASLMSASLRHTPLSSSTIHLLTAVRGGGGRLGDDQRLASTTATTAAPTLTQATLNTDASNNNKTYTVLSDPARGSPFHAAFPVHDLQLAKDFYGTILGCQEGRSSDKWQDYSLHGHQIVAHWVGSEYRCQDYYNPVDGDEVPVPRTYNIMCDVSIKKLFAFIVP